MSEKNTGGSAFPSLNAEMTGIDSEGNEHLFLGDSTYPHTPVEIHYPLSEAKDNEIRPRHLRHFGATVSELRAADRIEQLERELTEAQKGHARYEFVRKLNVYQFKKIFTMNLTSAVRFDDLIDAAIKEGKA